MYLWATLVVSIDLILVLGLLGLLYLIHDKLHVELKYIRVAMFTMFLAMTYHSFYEVHQTAVQRLFKQQGKATTTNADVAAKVNQWLNVFDAVGGLLGYLLMMTAGLLEKFIDKLTRIHERIDEFLGAIYDHLAEFILHYLHVPFNVVMTGIKFVAKLAGERLQAFLQTFQDAGNLIIQTLMANRDKVIREWFGSGDATDGAYDKAFALLLAYNILVVGVVSLVIYLAYAFIWPKIPRDWIPNITE